MSDFGKLNFSVAFNPTSAFPTDARTYFTSLEAAEAAAATAEEVGSTNTVYYFGMKVMVDDGNTVTWYTIQRPGVLVAEGMDIADTVSLLVEVDGEHYALDNASDPVATDETENTYSVEINK